MSATLKRNNLRPWIVNNKSKNNGEPLKDDWLKENWPALLDAHYECKDPGPSICLTDVLTMLSTKKVKITLSSRGRRGSASKEEEEEDRDLSPLELHIIKTWYDAKDKKLEEQRGESYIIERNLSSLSSAFHAQNEAAHEKTQDAVEKGFKETKEQLNEVKALLQGKGGSAQDNVETVVESAPPPAPAKEAKAAKEAAAKEAAAKKAEEKAAKEAAAKEAKATKEAEEKAAKEAAAKEAAAKQAEEKATKEAAAKEAKAAKEAAAKEAEEKVAKEAAEAEAKAAKEAAAKEAAAKEAEEKATKEAAETEAAAKEAEEKATKEAAETEAQAAKETKEPAESNGEMSEDEDEEEKEEIDVGEYLRRSKELSVKWLQIYAELNELEEGFLDAHYRKLNSELHDISHERLELLEAVVVRQRELLDKAEEEEEEDVDSDLFG